MASRKQLEAVLDQLVTSQNLRSLAISGDWGTGKTYLVKEHYEQDRAKELLRNANLSYVYVSLFGLTSIEEVRQRISVSAIGKNAKKLTGLLSRISKLAQNRVAIAGIELDLTTLGETSAHYIQEAVTKNLIVCLDDFERCDGIDSQQLLGLISELIEQRNCKCVLIYNHGKLADEKSQKLTSTEEKTFDLVLRFKPTLSENLPYGIKDHPNGLLVAPVFTNFGINNIRIMRRVDWVLDVLRRNDSEDTTTIWPIIARHAAVLCIVKYAFSDELPNLSDLTEVDTLGALMGLARHSEKLPENLRERLIACEYRPSEFDPAIIDLLQTGYLDEGAFSEAVATVAARVKHAEERDALDQMWRYPQSGFISDVEQYISDLKKFIQSPPAAVKPIEVVFLCENLLEITPDADSKQLVQEALHSHLSQTRPEYRRERLKECPNILQLEFIDSLPYLGEDERISFSEVFKNVAEDLSSWNPSFYKHLPEFTDDEIIEFLLAWRSPIAMAQFKAFLNRATTPGSTENNGEHKARIERLFREIASKNSFWKFQIENYVLKTGAGD